MRLQRVCAASLAWALGLWCGSSEAQTTGRARVVALAVARSPEVRASEAHVAVARARMVGVDVAARENPTLSVLGGPRRLVSGEVIPDVIVALSWPFDVAGVGSRRLALADAGVGMAEADARAVRLHVAFEAEALWLHAVAASAHIAVSQRQLEVNETASRIAQVRLARGVGAQDEVSLTALLVASAQAALEVARGDLAAALAELRVRLGEGYALDEGASVAWGDPPSLEALRESLGQRPDLVRAGLEVEVARRDSALQQRVGWVIPRVGASVGRENEYYGRLSVDVPLPVYQRNRTAQAVAEAQRGASSADARAMRLHAEAQLASSWERFQAARRARRVLEAASGAIDEAERLVTRGFELGQRELAAVVSALRETSRAREALCEARVAEAEAALAVEREGGVLP